MGILLKKGDMVQVMSGKERGKTGKILKMYRPKQRVLIEGLNKVKKHTKPSQQNPRGGIIEKEAPLHWSNVLLVDSKTGKGGRLGIGEKDGKRVRVFKKTGTELK